MDKTRQSGELLKGLRYAGTAAIDELDNMNEFIFDLTLNSGETFTVLLVDAVVYKGTKYCLIAELEDGCIITDKNGIIMLVIVKSTDEGFVSAAKDPFYLDIMKHFYAEMLMVTGAYESKVDDTPMVIDSGLQVDSREESMVSDKYNQLFEESSKHNKAQRVMPVANSSVNEKQFSVNTDDELFGFEDEDKPLSVGNPKALGALFETLDDGDYI